MLTGGPLRHAGSQRDDAVLARRVKGCVDGAYGAGVARVVATVPSRLAPSCGKYSYSMSSSVYHKWYRVKPNGCTGGQTGSVIWLVRLAKNVAKKNI